MSSFKCLRNFVTEKPHPNLVIKRIFVSISNFAIQAFTTIKSPICVLPLKLDL